MRADDRRVTTAENFWARVRMGDGCWEWQGRCDDKGYGAVGFRSRPARAHRVAWILAHGEIAPEFVVCHSCDNPPCCNPAHLFLGTQIENIADRHAKGRTVPPPSRAKLTDEQVHELRDLYAAGWTQTRLAARFPVSRGNISKILNRRLYSHV